MGWRFYVILTLAVLGFLFAARLVFSREAATLRVQQVQVINGRQYVLFEPMLPTKIGAWVEGGAIPRAGDVMNCRAEERTMKTVEVDGHKAAVRSLFLTCPGGSYRVDTVWFSH